MNSEHSTLIVGGGAAEDLEILTLANIYVTDCNRICWYIMKSATDT